MSDTKSGRQALMAFAYVSWFALLVRLLFLSTGNPQTDAGDVLGSHLGLGFWLLVFSLIPYFIARHRAKRQGVPLSWPKVMSGVTVIALVLAAGGFYGRLNSPPREAGRVDRQQLSQSEFAAPSPSVSETPVSMRPDTQVLSSGQVEAVLLYAEIRGDRIEGTFFNRNSDVLVSGVTIEIVPRDESNQFNDFVPRFVDVQALASPNSMSAPFSASVGPLNPSAFTLRVAAAKGSGAVSSEQPRLASRGWTYEPTGTRTFIVDPFKNLPMGTRFFRDSSGEIYRAYPPGSRPDLPKADPEYIERSTLGDPPR